MTPRACHLPLGDVSQLPYTWACEEGWGSGCPSPGKNRPHREQGRDRIVRWPGVVIKKKNKVQIWFLVERKPRVPPGLTLQWTQSSCLSEKPEAEERPERRGVQCHHAVPGHVPLRGHHLLVELGRQGGHL